MPPLAALPRPANEPTLFSAPSQAPARGHSGPGQVVGTYSGLLFEALRGVYSTLGLEAVEDQVFSET